MLENDCEECNGDYIHTDEIENVKEEEEEKPVKKSAPASKKKSKKEVEEEESEEEEEEEKPKSKISLADVRKKLSGKK